jgi:hypothetical protein
MPIPTIISAGLPPANCAAHQGISYNEWALARTAPRHRGNPSSWLRSPGPHHVPNKNAYQN